MQRNEQLYTKKGSFKTFCLNARGGEAGYILYVVLGGSAALVELISVVELILAGGVGEVWHRV